MKCKLENNFIEPCKNLDERLNGFGTKQKGLSFAEFVNFKTSERTRDIVFYRTSSKDKGLVLNFCPWCGEKISNHFE